MDIKIVKYISMKKNFLKRVLIRWILKKAKLKSSWELGVLYTSDNPAFKKYTKHGVEDYLNLKSPTRPRGGDGVVGCWIAHSKALESIDIREELSVILEDDFVCTDDFFPRAKKMIDNFNHSFDVIIFDPRGSGPLDSHLVAPGIYNPSGTSSPYYIGSQCIFVNNASIPKILSAKLAVPIKDIDGFFFANHSIKTYVFYTGLSQAQWLGSDIEVKNSLAIKLKGAFFWIKYRYFTSCPR